MAHKATVFDFGTLVSAIQRTDQHLELSKELQKKNVSNTGRRQLYQYLSFYRTYPQIVRTVPAQSRHLLPAAFAQHAKVRTASAQLALAPEKILGALSYSHLELLVGIENDLQRAFYEIECMRGNWSVRELKRQIGSLYYERSGLSKDKKKLAEMVRAGVETAEPQLTIRDPYVFDALVEYALAGMDNRLFVSKYQLELPKKDKMERFLEEQMKEIGYGR